MNQTDARRIVRARALAWDALSGDEQAEWLRRADAVWADLEEAASRPMVPPSQWESAARPAHRTATHDDEGTGR